MQTSITGSENMEMIKDDPFILSYTADNVEAEVVCLASTACPSVQPETKFKTGEWHS
jgi:hypothetical protein